MADLTIERTKQPLVRRGEDDEASIGTQSLHRLRDLISIVSDVLEHVEIEDRLEGWLQWNSGDSGRDDFWCSPFQGRRDSHCERRIRLETDPALACTVMQQARIGPNSRADFQDVAPDEPLQVAAPVTLPVVRDREEF